MKRVPSLSNRSRLASALVVFLALPAAVSAAVPDKVEGNVILGRVSASALAIWDATDRVAALEAQKKPADEITRTLESESAVAARSMASSVAQAKTITVRITYRRIGAISPAYGTATFQGVERFANVTYPTADLAGKASGYYDALAKGDTPVGVKVDVTGKLPS